MSRPIICPSCSKSVIERDMKLRVLSVRNKNIIDAGGEQFEVPPESKFLDTFYCSCGRFIKSRFRG